jgi:hypothetical protein
MQERSVMKRALLVAAIITAATSQFSLAQKTPTTRPASPEAKRSEATSTDPLQFRSLQAVLDVRERRQDWHKAAQQASDRIKDPQLRTQFDQRLAGLVPVVAKALIDHPQEDALATVAVFRDLADAKHQAMIAVTFDGLGGQVGDSFFNNVVAGKPKPPESEGIPKNLALDTEATSYLVFFVGKGELLAGDIPHAEMGRSVVAMINKQREAGQKGTGAVASAPNVAPPQPQPTTPPQVDTVNADVPIPPSANYIDASAYPMANDGYNYPTGAGVPIVILAGDTASADSLAQQRQRQSALDQRYQANPYGITAQSNNFITPQFGNTITPRSGNTITPQSGNYVKPQSGNSITPQSGNHVSGGSGNYVSGGSGNSVTGGSGNYVKPPSDNRPSGPKQFPKAGEPGGPPAKKNAPQQPSKGTPPPGAPGGPPADSGKK